MVVRYNLYGHVHLHELGTRQEEENEHHDDQYEPFIDNTDGLGYKNIDLGPYLPLP